MFTEMMETPDIDVDALDLRLIHALQIAPRARWSALGPLVGADAATLARRWARLTDEGIAWVTGHPGPALQGVSAMLEIACDPASTVALAAQTAQDPEAFTIDLTSGGRELLVIVTARDLGALSSYVTERMSGMTGIRATRTHPLSSTFTEASQWRLRALSRDEASAVERLVRRPVAPRATVDPELEAGLSRELARDGRLQVATLATRLGVGQRRAREGLATMLAHGRLVLRTDVAKSRSGWPVHAWFFLRVPAGIMDRVGSALARINEIRLAVTAVGPYNLVLSVWMRSLADVQRLEMLIEERLEGVTIVDRSAVLRTVKNLGHMLEPDGRWTGEVLPIPSFRTG